MTEPTDPKAPAEGAATPSKEEAPKAPPRDPAAEAAALAALEAELSGEAPPPPKAPPAEVAEAAAVAKAESAAEKLAQKPMAKEPPKADAAAAAAAAAKAKAKPAVEPPDDDKPDPDDDPDKIPTAPPWYKRLRADPPRITGIALGLGLVALILLVWFLVTLGSDPTARIVSPSKLPSPGEVFGSFGKLLSRELDAHLLASMIRVVKGIGLAAIIGVSLGVLAGSQRGVAAAVEPLVIFLRSVPMGALIPLTLLLFGDGEKQKWMFIFLAVVPFVFSDTVKAISIVPERYVETAQTLGASRWQIIYKVLVPLSLPDIITSLRFLLGLALGYIMLVEVVDTPHGIGSAINTSQRLGMYDQIYMMLFVITLVAFLLDFLLRGLQRELFRWRKDL